MQSVALTRQQFRMLDQRAMEVYGMSGLVLMENAGRGTVDVLERLGISGLVIILCGKGNNAGDGLVIARHLEIRGRKCRVLLLSPPEDLAGDAAANFSILRKSAVPIFVAESTERSELRRWLNLHAAAADWLVDAMLGTGSQGEPRPPFDTAIDWFNEQHAHKLAVDVPSGLDCDTGESATHTVRVDHTCTFAAMKIGYNEPAAQSFTGQVHVCDIGTPLRLLEDITGGTN